MLEKCVLTILELNWNQRLGHKRTKLNICHHMLTSSTQLQNRSFHVVERTRTSTKCQKMKNARAKRAKLLFFIVNYTNLWGFCCRRRRGCLSSLFSRKGQAYKTVYWPGHLAEQFCTEGVSWITNAFTIIIVTDQGTTLTATKVFITNSPFTTRSLYSPN